MARYTKRKSIRSRSRKRVFKPKRGKITKFKRGTTLGLGLPSTLSTTLRYSETIGLTSTAGSVPDHVFSLNSLFDPNVTGIGHQPMYFDQLIALYNHYTVIGAKITVTCTPATNSTLPCRVVMTMDDDGIIGGNIDTLQEYGKSKSIVRTVTGSSPQKMTMFWSAKRNFKGSILGNTLFRGSSAASPAEQSYAAISLHPVDGASTVSCYFSVIVEYISVFAELKDIGGS